MKHYLKLFSMVLIIFAAFFFLPPAIAPVDAVTTSITVEGGTCEFDAETGTITEFTPTSDNVVIPDKINNVTVTAIGTKAFANCYDLTSVSIPEGVTSIGDEAFYYCTQLTEITIPSSVTSIGNGIFRSCGSLTTISVASDNAAYTSQNGVLFNKDKTVLVAFPSNYGKSYEIPAGVKSIAPSAFRECYRLQNLSIPEGLESIGDYAFSNCGFTSLILPEGLKTIGSSAFQSCYNLTSINIPYGVTRVEESTFYYCSKLSSVSISKSVTYIGNDAFSSCALTKVDIPASVTKIANSAFNSCSSLKEAYFYGDAPESGYSVFSNVASDFKVYYLSFRSGFSSYPWNTYPTATFTSDVGYVSVSAISISPSSISMTQGKSLQLTPSVSPVDAVNKNVTWSITSGNGVVSIENGLVSALTPGTAVIKATSADDSSKSAECTITVTPITLSKISKTAAEIDGKATDVTISTANYFQSGNYYGSTKAVYIVSGLTRQAGLNYTAEISTTGSSSTAYLNWIDNNTAYFSQYIYNDGDQNYSVTIKATSGSTINLQFAETDFSFEIVSALPGTPSIDDLNPAADINIGSINKNSYYLNLMVPKEFNAANSKLELLDPSGNVVARNNPKDYINYYDSTVNDPRYTSLFGITGDVGIKYSVKNIGGTLYVDTLIGKGIYSARVSNDSESIEIVNALRLIDIPYITYSSYPSGYPRIKAGSQDIYAEMTVRDGEYQDYKLGIYDSSDVLIAETSDYIIKSVYNGQVNLIHKLTLKAGKSITPGDYKLRIITSKVYETDSKEDFTIYNSTSPDLIRIIVPNNRVANIVLLAQGYTQAEYKAVLKRNDVEIANKIVNTDVNGNFDIEFTDENGNVLAMDNNTPYSVQIKERNSEGSWESYGNSFSFYNNFIQQSGSSGESTEDYYDGYSGIYDGYVYAAFNVKDSIAANLEMNKFKLIAYSAVLGTEYTYNNLKLISNIDETGDYTYIYFRQDLLENMPEGNYTFKIFYDGVEIKDKDENNICQADWYSQYKNGEVDISYWQEVIDNRSLITAIFVNGANPAVVQLKLYKLTNSNVTPDYVINMSKDTDSEGYLITSANSSMVDLSCKYNAIVYADGIPIGDYDGYAFIPYDSDFKTMHSITLVQPANGTISSSIASGTVGKTVYINCQPNSGYKLKLGSIKVNGKPIYGRSFILTGDATVTAEFQTSNMTKYTIEVGGNINNGSITVDKASAFEGETVKVTATNNPNYRLSSLTYKDKATGAVTNIDMDTRAFSMPNKNIIVEAQFAFVQEFNLSINSTNNGKIEVDKSSAAEGTIVNLTITPDTSYRLKQNSLYYIISGSSEKHYISGSSLQMPGNNITIYAEFEAIPKYTITIDQNVINGNITLVGLPAMNNIYEGQQITVSAIAVSDNYLYKEGSLSYYKVGDSSNKVSITNNSFLMPGYDIVLYAEFQIKEGAVTNAALDITQAAYNDADISVTVTFNGKTLSGIYNSAVKLQEGVDYTVSNQVYLSDGKTLVSAKYIINKSFLSALPKGITKLTFDFNEGIDADLAVTVPKTDECFIATAAFGSKLEPAVVMLRHFRDNCLLTNRLGTKFVEFYYKNSPPIAHFIAGNDTLRAIVRVLLIPLIIIAYGLLNPLQGCLGLAVLMIICLYVRRKKLLLRLRK